MLLSKVLGFSLLAASAVHAFGSYRDYDEIALRDALDIVADHYDLTYVFFTAMRVISLTNRYSLYVVLVRLTTSKNSLPAPSPKLTSQRRSEH